MIHGHARMRRWLLLLAVTATSQDVAITKAATRVRRASAPGVGERVLLCAAVCDRVDHHQGHHGLPGLVQVGQFLNSTRALARGGSNTSFVIIDWKECLPLHPAHVVVRTPAFIDTRATWSPNDFRFTLYVAFLRAHPQVRQLVIVDGRDTLLRTDPVPRAAHALYAGVNVGGCGNRAAHAPPRCREFLQKCERGYLNAGLLGGDRDVVQGIVVDVVIFLEACEVDGDCRGGNKVPSHNLNMIAVNCVVAQRLSNGSLDLRTGPPFQGAWVDHDRRWALDRRGEHDLALRLNADLRAANATRDHVAAERRFFDPATVARRLATCPDGAALRRAAVPPLDVLAARGARPTWDGYLDVVYNNSVTYPFDLDALDWLYDFSPLGALQPVAALPRCAVPDGTAWTGVGPAYPEWLATERAKGVFVARSANHTRRPVPPNGFVEIMHVAHRVKINQ